jgi:GT2 family glycosyltransferase
MVDNHPLVSIVLPVRDGELFIGDTLASALGQTYQNLEVIVVDDGSRDGTQAVVEAWIARDSRVRMMVQTNRGVADARNRAIAAARGEFIAPLDADDLWDPTKIERQVRRMNEAGETTGLVYCWWVRVDVNGALLDCSPKWHVEGRAAELLLEVNFTGSASVPLYRRRYLDQVGGYDVTLHERDAQGSEDWDVALKVAERSRVAVVPSWLVGYRRRQNSMSFRGDRMWRSHVLVLNGARQRRPELAPGSIRRSQGQLALHLASVSFWSGAYLQAIGWGLRASRSRLAFQVLPYIGEWLFTRLQRGGRPTLRTIAPGVPFSGWKMDPPLIPYDRIYQRRIERMVGE